jgi:GNAT superfamily N-acetyltransferase
VAHIRRLEPGPQVAQLYNEIFRSAFPPAELCGLSDFEGMIAGGQPCWIAVDDDDRVLGGASCEWDDPPRIMLLAWLAVRPELRGQGMGNQLLDVAGKAWREQWGPCLALAEVEDPAHHHGSEATGDPVARLRFYQRRGARALDIPYFQAALGAGGERVPDLLLMVLDTYPEFAGAQPDTIDPAVVRSYLELYQRQCEGAVGTDPQAMRLWDAIDAHPEGIAYRDL